jgi:hypothetical protein
VLSATPCGFPATLAAGSNGLHHIDGTILTGGSMKKKFVAPLIREEATLSQLTLMPALSGAFDFNGP